MPQSRKRPTSQDRKPFHHNKIRYATPGIADSLTIAMIGKPAPELVRGDNIAHMWGFACVDATTAEDQSFFEFEIENIEQEHRSPVLDIAAELLTRLPRGRVWGYGLAYQAMTLAIDDTDDLDTDDKITATAESLLHGDPAAEAQFVATVIDGRGRVTTSTLNTFMPELGTTTHHEHSLDSAHSIAEWTGLFHVGATVAHLWAAALALDTRNRELLRALGGDTGRPPRPASMTWASITRDRPTTA